MIFRNFLKIFSSKYWIIWSLIWFVIMSLPTYFFTLRDAHQMKMWMWDTHFYLVFGLDAILIFLFGIFLWWTLYKMVYFWNRKTSKIWFLGGFLGSLVWGCTSCSLTLASVLGLWSFMAFLPYWWLEIKIFSVLLLVYVCFNTLKNLEICNLKI